MGKCLLQRKLGEGGMGAVYLAQHMTLSKMVAVKILRSDLPRDMKAIERFLREARAAARLDHSAIVPIYDAGQDGGTYFIVMQYVQGESLASRLRREKVLPVREAIRIFRQAAEGIRHAHQKNVIHRDIKPDNILLGEEGSVKLADFGLAYLLEGDPNLSRTGIIMGSPNFMSPEQALGRRVDQRSDVYSLGATLYQMVTGVPPFEADTTLGVVCKVVKEPLRPPHAANPAVPLSLSRYICVLMRRDAKQRIPSVDDALSFLDRMKEASARGAKRKPPKRWVTAVTFLLVATSMISAGIFLVPVSFWRPLAGLLGVEAESHGARNKDEGDRTGDKLSKELLAPAAGKAPEGVAQPLAHPSDAADDSRAAKDALTPRVSLGPEKEKALRSRFEELKSALQSGKPRALLPFVDPEHAWKSTAMARRPFGGLTRIVGDLSANDLQEATLRDIGWEDAGRQIARAVVEVPGRPRLSRQLWVLREGVWFLIPPK